MPSQNKLIKQGIQYTDSLFDEISKRLEQGVRASDSLEAFLDKYNKAFPDKGNPLLALGYDTEMLKLILSETNNHKFSRPAQKELVRVTIESQVGDLIVDVGEDIKNSVRDIVKDGYDNNLSQDEIAANISSKVSAIKGRRARAIARTEIARTATISDYVINKERGATHFYVECRNTACPVCKEAWHKHWSKSNDESFTPSDSSAGGKGWIGDKVYSMSDTMMLPPIHPNCRCVPYFISEDDVPEGISVEKPTPKETTATTTTKPVKNTEPRTTESSVEEQITPYIEKFITDQEDVKVIAGQISSFVKESEKLDHEIIRLIDTDRYHYENSGDEGSVQLPYEAIGEGLENGLLFSIHNHPDGSLIHSVADINCATTFRQQLSATYCYQTKELLLMNNKYAINNKNGEKIDKAYYKVVYGEKIYSKYTDSRKEIMAGWKKSKEHSRVVKAYKNGKISKEEFDLKSEEKYDKWRMNRLDKDIKEWNELLKDEGVEFVRVKLE